jgi:hypothetical protein
MAKEQVLFQSSESNKERCTRQQDSDPEGGAKILSPGKFVNKIYFYVNPR